MSLGWPPVFMPWFLLSSTYHRLPPHHRRALLLLCGAGLLWGTLKTISCLYREWRLMRRVREKRAAIASDKAALSQRLVAQEGAAIGDRGRITRLSLRQLRDALRSGRLRPPEVLAAYQAQALVADGECNCVTGVLLDADADARRLDQLPTSERQRLPLFGVPVSVKEHLAVEGADCTFGNPSYTDRPRDAEAVVVRMLRRLGAVPFVRTNMSQMGFAIDCRNALFGETSNPHDCTRSPGGSSGGEAALLALEGSPLGIGSDVGGSIRIPAALCGVYGFKPTSERVSSLDCPPVDHAQSYVVSLSVGPMARDVDALVTACEVLFSAEMSRMDPYCPLMPYRPVPAGQRLKVGYYITLKGEDAIRAVPAVQRGVMMAKEALERRGHHLVPWSPPHLDDMLSLCLGAYFTDGGVGLRTACAQEKVTRDLALCSALFSLPALGRIALAFLVRPLSLLLSRQMAAMMGCGSVYRLWRFFERLGAYSGRFMSQWVKHELDVVICPTLPFVAPPLGDSSLLSGAVIYCALYNVLSYPAGVVPVTKVEAGDLRRLEEEYPTDDLLLKYLSIGQRGTKSLPVGVQCVAMKWKDEMCLYAMKELEVGLEEMEEPEVIEVA